MKKLIVVSAALAAAFFTPAFAGNDMACMDMSTKASAMKVSNNALTDAEVKKVDAATGMVNSFFRFVVGTFHLLRKRSNFA